MTQATLMIIIFLSFAERVTDDYVYDLLYSAKEAQMNMLRVWGGKFMFYVQFIKIYAYQWVIFSLVVLHFQEEVVKVVKV